MCFVEFQNVKIKIISNLIAITQSVSFYKMNSTNSVIYMWSNKKQQLRIGMLINSCKVQHFLLNTRSDHPLYFRYARYCARASFSLVDKIGNTSLTLTKMKAPHDEKYFSQLVSEFCRPLASFVFSTPRSALHLHISIAIALLYSGV